MGYTQQNRRFEVRLPSEEPDLLLLERLEAHEAISQLYSIELDLLSERSDIPIDEIVGQSLFVRMDLPEGSEVETRHFHGIVSSFSQSFTGDELTSYRATVVPWLWLLTRSSDCRIHQHQSIPEILAEVFDRHPFADYRLHLNGSHPKLEYCVQYRESHFAFVSRLMEQAGIGYYFEHSEKGHVLVLFDDPSGNPAVRASREAAYGTAHDEDRPSGEIVAFSYRRDLHTGRCTIRDYRFEDPSFDLTVESKSDSTAADRGLERYDYHPERYRDIESGTRLARLELEIEEARSYRIAGRSSRGDFSCGHHFELVGHERAEYCDDFLLTSVTHHATQGYSSDTGGETDYSNVFTAIPHSIAYRPPRVTPKPVIHGAQTATVVGAGDLEIDVDEHARVVVQFHWDRIGQRDEASSCRVRVAQATAGKGWGGVSHPRIGQEVVVEFLEGDPDRPLITGRLYNGLQAPPYALPGNATQGGLRSHSSPGGGAGNFNELRFEDRMGQELVSMQAEKDLSRTIKNDESDSVGNDRSRSVGNNETISIGVDSIRTIGNDQRVDVGSNADEIVGSAKSIDVGQTLSINAGTSITFRCGASSIHMNQAGIITISGTMIAIAGAVNASMTAPITNVTGGVMLTNTGAVNLVQGAVTRVEGGSLVHLGGGKAEVVGGSETIVQGGTVKIN